MAGNLQPCLVITMGQQSIPALILCLPLHNQKPEIEVLHRFLGLRVALTWVPTGITIRSICVGCVTTR